MIRQLENVSNHDNAGDRLSLERLRHNDASFTSWAFECKRHYQRHRCYYLLCRALERNTHLRDLILQNYATSDSYDSQYLAKCIGKSKVESLTMWWLRFSHSHHPIDVPLLCEVLCKSSTLYKLTIQEGCFADQGFALLARGLERNKTLTHLELDNCNIGDDDVRSLVRHWPLDSPFESLSLPNNNIGPAGAQVLLRAVQDHPALQSLNLSRNRSIGYEGLRLIGEELVNQHYLTDIQLDSCSVSVGDETTALRLAGQALAEGIRRNRTIKHMDVSSNALPEDVCKQICLYTHLNSTGGRLLLSIDHQVAVSVWCLILAKCSSHPYRQQDWNDAGLLPANLIFFFLREQPNLVQPQSFSSVAVDCTKNDG